PPGPHEARLWLAEGSAAHRLAAAQQVAQAFARPTQATEPDRKQFAPAVLARLQAGGLDTHLRHALTLALIRIGAVEITRAALQDSSADVRRAALIALDQMPDAKLKETEVIALLDTDDADLLEAVLEVISRHE